MAQISITIPDEHVTRVLDAFASRFRYDQNKLEGETKPQFAKRMLAEQIRLITLREERAAHVDSFDFDEPGVE